MLMSWVCYIVLSIGVLYWQNAEFAFDPKTDPTFLYNYKRYDRELQSSSAHPPLASKHLIPVDIIRVMVHNYIRNDPPQ